MSYSKGLIAAFAVLFFLSSQNNVASDTPTLKEIMTKGSIQLVETGDFIPVALESDSTKRLIFRVTYPVMYNDLILIPKSASFICQSETSNIINRLKVSCDRLIIQREGSILGDFSLHENDGSLHLLTNPAPAPRLALRREALIQLQRFERFVAYE